MPTRRRSHPKPRVKSERPCSRKAWERRKSLELGNLSSEPRGFQSRLAEPGQPPEASLARGGTTLTAKRPQPGPRPWGRAPKTKVARSLRRGQGRGPRRSRFPWSHRTRPVLPGSESTGNDPQGSPGTWETPSSPPQSPAREPNHQLPGAPGGASATEGSKHPTQRWYRQAKATKRGERGGGESESLIVSLKRGDRPSWAPWREGEISLWARRQATRESIGPHQRVTVRVSKPTEGRYHSVTSRVWEIRKHGSVGARGEQSPWTTRPFGSPAFVAKLPSTS